MSNKTVAYCDRIIEAGLLITLIVTPLYINVFSNRSVEPDKIAIIRLIVLIILAAWTVRGIEKVLARRQTGEGNTAFSGRRNMLRSLWQTVRDNPVPSLAILFFISCALATLTSITPRLSLWGSYQRMDGLYTLGCYLVICLSMFALIRKREQIDRLLAVIIMTALPVSLYGILQHHELEILHWSGDTSTRVSSTMGNPIFLSAYLIMAVPVTLSRLLQRVHDDIQIAGRRANASYLATIILCFILQCAAWMNGPILGTFAAIVIMVVWSTAGARQFKRPPKGFFPTAVYLAMLAIQITCIMLTYSRGPLLGLICGLFIFGLIYAFILFRQRWRVFMTATVIAVLVILSIAVIPSLSVQDEKKSSFIDRFGEVFEGNGKVRLLIWEGTIRLIRSESSRLLFGYGPETLFVAYPPYFDPELRILEGDVKFPDRAHNESFELLMTAGITGLFIYLCLIISLLYCALSLFGSMERSRQRTLFILLMTAGGATGTVLAYLIDNSIRFMGVALPLGMMAGLALYIVIAGTAFAIPRKDNPNMSSYLVIIGFIAAVVAHFVEIQFGIGVSASRVYFWSYAGLLAAQRSVTRRSVTLQSNIPHELSNLRADRVTEFSSYPPSRTGALAMFVLMSVVLITMMFNFLLLPIPGISVLISSFLIVSTAMFLCLMIIGERSVYLADPFTLKKSKEIGIIFFSTIITVLIFSVFREILVSRLLDISHVPMIYFVTLLALMIGASGVLGDLGRIRIKYKFPGYKSIAYLLTAILFYFVLTLNLNIVRADIKFKEARLLYHAHGRLDPAIELYKQAVALYPTQDYYYTYLAQALTEKSWNEQSTQHRNNYFVDAENSIKTALQLSPLNIDHQVNLAQIYRVRAGFESDSEQRNELLQNASILFENALRRNAGNVLLWNESSSTELQMGNLHAAREKLLQSISIDPGFPQTYLLLGELSLIEQYWHDAVAAFGQAISFDNSSAEAYYGLGTAYVQLGRFEEAVHAYCKAVEYRPYDHIIHTNLVILYHYLGDTDAALYHAQRAIQRASGEEYTALNNFINQLRSEPEN